MSVYTIDPTCMCLMQTLIHIDMTELRIQNGRVSIWNYLIGRWLVWIIRSWFNWAKKYWYSNFCWVTEYHNFDTTFYWTKFNPSCKKHIGTVHPEISLKSWRPLVVAPHNTHFTSNVAKNHLLWLHLPMLSTTLRYKVVQWYPTGQPATRLYHGVGQLHWPGCLEPIRWTVGKGDTVGRNPKQLGM